MDHLLYYGGIFLLLLAAAIGWLLTVMGLPGNWLMVSAAGFYAWLGPATGTARLEWGMVVALALIAAVGELAELAAGVWGTRRAGGSRRAAVLALFGSLAGAVVGAMMGLPIPLIGPPVAALFGGAIGALVGAALGEHSRGEAAGQSLRVGHAAFWGRLLGTGIKTLAATAIAVALVVSLIL